MRGGLSQRPRFGMYHRNIKSTSRSNEVQTKSGEQRFSVTVLIVSLLVLIIQGCAHYCPE